MRSVASRGRRREERDDCRPVQSALLARQNRADEGRHGCRRRSESTITGVIHFDVAQDTTDPNALIATEVFHDRAAMDRQEAQPEVARVMELVEAGALAGAPEWTIYEVSSAESPEM